MKQLKTNMFRLLVIAGALTGFAYGTASPAYASISEWQQGMTLHLNNQSEADIASSLIISSRRLFMVSYEMNSAALSKAHRYVSTASR